MGKSLPLFVQRDMGSKWTVVSGPFSQSVIWGEPDSSRQNRKGRQQLLENAQHPDFNLRVSQSVLPVEHSVTPCQLNDHTAPVHCCTSASHQTAGVIAITGKQIVH